MIIEITAKFSCDDCGTEFFVGIDPAYVPSLELSMFAVAEDAIRSGVRYEDATEDGMGVTGSVEDGRHYCARCTRRRDAR